jgi:hypothetical protein
VNNAGEDKVELFGPSPDVIYPIKDRATGEYIAPCAPESAKNMLKTLYLAKTPSGNEQTFEAAWPYVWRLTDYPRDPTEGLSAFLDSGISPEHPLLADCIQDAKDFSGSDSVLDRCGHGTYVTLIQRSLMLGVPRKLFVIAKVVDDPEAGSNPERLVRALDWLVEYNRERSPKIRFANLSLGVYAKRGCDGSCAVCEAAVRAIENGIFIVAAAGNISGKTACPAKLAFTRPDLAMVAVEDAEFGGTGKGTVAAVPPRNLVRLGRADQA